VNQELWEWFEKAYKSKLDEPINKMLAGTLDSLAGDLEDDGASVKTPEEVSKT